MACTMTGWIRLSSWFSAFMVVPSFRLNRAGPRCATGRGGDVVLLLLAGVDGFRIAGVVKQQGGTCPPCPQRAPSCAGRSPSVGDFARGGDLVLKGGGKALMEGIALIQDNGLDDPKAAHHGLLGLATMKKDSFNRTSPAMRTTSRMTNSLVFFLAKSRSMFLALSNWGWAACFVDDKTGSYYSSPPEAWLPMSRCCSTPLFGRPQQCAPRRPRSAPWFQ